MFISFRSKEEATEQAKADKDSILASNRQNRFVINQSTTKITPTYKDYLDQLVIEVNADAWDIQKVDDNTFNVGIIWNSQDSKKAA